ncbi:hypothetical protein [Halostagnicola sp. A-GB9-2]|uniref:hypothetical protein n=1 Tax=Halostagnicola sp. A-GB9-2 TaxID=3048066 RepID=UPI0024BFA6E3|nr:hypothetical protein [Halostagnicola sp. A-GB9-2]MDJ1433020.1 hypothetical protein [Halostagnicola sp. A-GB9-2]
MLELLSEFRGIIFPVFYVGFFLGTLVLLALSDREVARSVWVGGFILVLLAVTVVGTPLMPVVEMHKFSQPNDEQNTAHEFVVVDADGNELYYDYRAAPPTTGSRSSTIAGHMVEEYPDEDRIEIAEFYLSNAQEYRSDVESGDYPPPTEPLAPPRYTDDKQWSAEELEEFETFEAIRIYERTLTVTDDNTEIESHERDRRLTVNVGNQTITEHEHT